MLRFRQLAQFDLAEIAHSYAFHWPHMRGCLTLQHSAAADFEVLARHTGVSRGSTHEGCLYDSSRINDGTKQLAEQHTMAYRRVMGVTVKAPSTLIRAFDCFFLQEQVLVMWSFGYILSFARGQATVSYLRTENAFRPLLPL